MRDLRDPREVQEGNVPPGRRKSSVSRLLWLLIGIVLIVLIVLGALYYGKVLPTNPSSGTSPGSTATPTALTGNYPANIEGGSNGYGVYNASDLTNPNIEGVDIKMDWAYGEPSQGNINFAPMDKEMSAWVSHGKKFTIIIRYVHEPVKGSCNSSSQYLPTWEVARIPTFCTSNGTRVPDYFNSTFKSDLLAYVSAIAQHVAASPYKKDVAYVRIGVGMGGEGYPCIKCSASDMQQLDSWGYSVTNWKAWQESMMMSFKKAFPFAPVIYPMGYGEKDPATGQYVDQEVAYWAAANGMGVGQQGLNDKAKYANGRIVQTFKYVRAHYPTAYLQYTTVLPVKSASQVQGDIAIAAASGAFSIEWYPQDASNPAYQQYFQQWAQIVSSKTGEIPAPSTPLASLLTGTLSYSDRPQQQGD